MSLGSGLVAEQLAYVAALAVDAAIIYCDRPKADTYAVCVCERESGGCTSPVYMTCLHVSRYRRLFDRTTIVDLDRAFGQASWRNYQVGAAACLMMYINIGTDDVYSHMCMIVIWMYVSVPSAQCPVPTHLVARVPVTVGRAF